MLSRMQTALSAEQLQKEKECMQSVGTDHVARTLAKVSVQEESALVG